MIVINSEDSYKTVVEEFSDMIFRIAYQNLFHIADAEDVVQEVFIKLLRQKNCEFADKEHLKAWLIRVTLNQCTDFRRMFRKVREEPLENYNFGFTAQDNSMLDLIAELPKEERTMIYLYYYEGYKIREIAEILGKGQNTVNSKLVRARKKLKHMLEDL